MNKRQRKKNYKEEYERNLLNKRQTNDLMESLLKEANALVDGIKDLLERMFREIKIRDEEN